MRKKRLDYPIVQLDWSEKVHLFQIHPEAASPRDVARLAEELFYAKRENQRMRIEGREYRVLAEAANQSLQGDIARLKEQLRQLVKERT